MLSPHNFLVPKLEIDVDTVLVLISREKRMRYIKLVSCCSSFLSTDVRLYRYKAQINLNEANRSEKKDVKIIKKKVSS